MKVVVYAKFKDDKKDGMYLDGVYLYGVAEDDVKCQELLDKCIYATKHSTIVPKVITTSGKCDLRTLARAIINKFIESEKEMFDVEEASTRKLKK